MKKRYRRRKYGRRRGGKLSASNWGPILKLLGAVFGILTVLAVLVLGVMVLLEAVFKVDTPLKPDGIIAGVTKLFSDDDVLVVTPTPYYTPEPTPTPHPIEFYDPEEDEREVVLPVDMQYYWFGDPYVYNGSMIFTAGQNVDGEVHMCALIKYEPQTGKIEELPIKPNNVHFIYPVFNDDWLVYLDANYNGGGDICAYPLNGEAAEPIKIKTVYVAQPELRLDGNYIAWMERTGSNRDKLYVCDVTTQESTTIQIFSGSGYGTSMPDLHEGLLIWAADDSVYYEDGRTTSVIKYININSSSIKEYSTGTYVHDPETNGEYYAWIDAHHSVSSRLYIAKAPTSSNSLSPELVAEGVVDFYIDEQFVAYSIDETVYVYVFETGRSYRVTPERELAQLMGASDGYVIWMDVTTRERDVLKYAKIPL